MDIVIDQDIFNEKYLQTIDINNRYQLYYGGSGTGKSYFVAQKIIYNLLKIPNIIILVCRKVARTNKFSTYSLLSNIISE